MKKKKFNPKDFLAKPKEIFHPDKKETIISRNSVSLLNDDIEQLIQIITTSKTDIADSYENWRNIGFALADEFGENGREYYHQISQHHLSYNSEECNKQYTSCLNSKGHGIKISSLFYLAKKNGVSIQKNTTKPIDSLENQSLPTFPKSLFPQLPDFLKEVTKNASSDEERDILLLGSIISLGATIPNIYGLYDNSKVYPNLFLFITAQAAAGKGKLILCKNLVKPIHLEKRNEAAELKHQYDIEIREYNIQKKKNPDIEKPNKPPEKMLFIPANNSATGAFQLLSDNEGYGLIFETEGDTLALTFSSDYGNYSDGLRKAFHHEPISYYRRTDREYVDIEKPRISAILSATPNQISTLIPDAENGLFSRFVFYFMNTKVEWKNVFSNSIPNGLESHFNELGLTFKAFYDILKSKPEIQFNFTKDQENQFNVFFEQIQKEHTSILGLDYIATIRRLGLIAFRMAMIISTLRIMDKDKIPKSIICNQQDFNTTIEIIKILLHHSSKVFKELPGSRFSRNNIKRDQLFLSKLPSQFNRAKYIKVALALNIPSKSAEGYITKFIKTGQLNRIAHDNYTKDSLPNKDSP